MDQTPEYRAAFELALDEMNAGIDAYRKVQMAEAVVDAAAMRDRLIASAMEEIKAATDTSEERRVKSAETTVASILDSDAYKSTTHCHHKITQEMILGTHSWSDSIANSKTIAYSHPSQVTEAIGMAVKMATIELLVESNGIY